ncbi:MAG: GspH/FimT family pseudopilin [bacterium]
MPRLCDQEGFTIIELVMVVCMIALIMSFSGPSLEGYMRAIKTKAAAREIYTMLQQARLSAIRENRSIVADFTPAGEEDSNDIYSERGKVEITYPDGQVVSMDLSSSSEFMGTRIKKKNNTIDITFYGNGTASTQTVCVKHDDESVTGYNLVTNTAGGIRIEKSEDQ